MERNADMKFIFKLSHLKRARKASLRILDPIWRQVVELKSWRQSYYLCVPVSAFSHPDLDADDVNPIYPPRVFWGNSDATDLLKI